MVEIRYGKEAKSIKSHNFELQKQLLELEVLAQKGRLSKDAEVKFDKAIAGYEDNLKRYDGEKKDIKAKAEDLAKNKETAQRRAGTFGFALIFIQTGIMLSSISAVKKKKSFWLMGLVTAFVGVLYSFDGFYFFY